MHEHLALGNERALGDADLSDHALHSGDDFVAAGAQSDGHQEGGNDSERNAHGQRGEQSHPHFRDWRIHQEQSTQREQHDAARSKHAVAGELGLQRKHRERDCNQGKGSKADG